MNWCCWYIKPRLRKNSDDYEILKSSVDEYQNQCDREIKSLKTVVHNLRCNIKDQETELSKKDNMINQLQKDLVYANEITQLNSRLYTIPEYKEYKEYNEEFDEEEQQQEMILSCLLDEIKENITGSRDIFPMFEQPDENSYPKQIEPMT